MTPITDHPLRYQLANELHARPFPTLTAPGHAIYLAIKHEDGAARRDRAADFAHLVALLDRHGAPHPPPQATHYSGRIGRVDLKWESHSEFVTYTVFTDSIGARAFDADLFKVFPEDWLAQAPGVRVTSALIRLENLPEPETLSRCLRDWFVPESLAVSHVLEASAVIAGDFRIDTAGHMRFALFLAPGTGTRRTGRIVQRLCEIETYKAMAMLGFQRARALSQPLGRIADALNTLTDDMVGETVAPDATLAALMPLSAELENLMARSNYRFGATTAYGTIVDQRIAVLREERFQGRQTFGEFMMRRFDPAMRTVKAVEGQLQDMSARARRAGELLRTRVDVERSAQNQALLESMDRRADAQLRLQKTVEGLSVVAISYYAVSLAGYFLAPLAKAQGIDKAWLIALLVPVVVATVWAVIRRIRRAVH